MNELLAVIKTALKISGTALDTEISRYISAALKELERVGIVINADSYSEPLIVSAAELYCKWQYDYLGQGERFAKAFSDLRNALSLTSAYTEVTDNGTK